MRFTRRQQSVLMMIQLMMTTSMNSAARAFGRPAAISQNLASTCHLLMTYASATSSTNAQDVTPRDSLAETSKTGEFQRRDSAWRRWISREEGAEFPPESGRYHLICAMACPWAHRTLITRSLKGLQDVISLSVVHPVWQRTRPNVKGDSHRGWVFGNPSGPPLQNFEGRGGPFPPAFAGNNPDPLFGFGSVRDFYVKAGDTEGKYSVPVLWDKKTQTIVSNESADILRMLNSEFNDLAQQNRDLDLYPQGDPELQRKIDAVNDWVYPNLNNGVYRCGFAKSQEAYDKAIDDLTDAFDRVERILEKQRFIAGDTVTEADIRLFVTLLRFDEVYIVYFKTNTRSVANSDAILNYCREIYQMPGVKETVDMEQIKFHYYASHPELNYYSIVPKGSNFVALLEQPHNRGNL